MQLSSDDIVIRVITIVIIIITIIKYLTWKFWKEPLPQIPKWGNVNYGDREKKSIKD